LAPHPISNDVVRTREVVEATCPDCSGPLYVIRYDTVVEYRCLVGHSYSTLGLLRAHAEAQESVLWSAVASLEQSMNLVRQVTPNLSAENIRLLETQAELKLQLAKEIRTMIERLG
jgi:two-component system chemotaxis response regulator CheB